MMNTMMKILMVGTGLLCAACGCGNRCAPTANPEVKSYDIDLTDGKVITLEGCCSKK